MIFWTEIDSAENFIIFLVCFIHIFGLKIIDRYMSYFSLHHSLMVFLHCRCMFCFNPLYIFQFLLCFELEFLVSLVLYSYLQLQSMRRILHRNCTLKSSSLLEFTLFGIHNDAFCDLKWFFITHVFITAIKLEVMFGLFFINGVV